MVRATAERIIMDTNSPTFHGSETCRQLSAETIAYAAKDDMAEVTRIPPK